MGKASTALLLVSTLFCAGAARAEPDELTVDFPPFDDIVQTMVGHDHNAKVAIQKLRDAPEAPETLKALLVMERGGDAVRVFHDIVAHRPERIPEALEILSVHTGTFLGPGGRRVHEVLIADLEVARQRLPELPRESAARGAWTLLRIQPSILGRNDPSDLARDRDAYIEKYRGTEAATLAETDAVTSTGTPAEKLAAVDRYVKEHPGTIAAAKLLHWKAFELHASMTDLTKEPPGADPTERYLQVLEIVKELESGRYPRCEWTEKAADLVVGFFAYLPKYAPGNLRKVIDGTQHYVETHFVVSASNPTGAVVGYLVADKLPLLYAEEGSGDEGVHRFLETLARAQPDPAAVRYLQAHVYIHRATMGPPARRAEGIAKGKAILAVLSSEGTLQFSRSALASLASLALLDGELAEAAAAYRRYRDLYPQSGWTWVASLRLGECQEAGGDARAATITYAAAAAAYAKIPAAAVIGHAFAAQAHESLGQFREALAEYQLALGAWNLDFGTAYIFFARRAHPAPTRLFDRQVDKAELSRRIGELQRTQAFPGGDLVERGRRLMVEGHPREAENVLGQAIAKFPRSPAVPEARSLAHLARLGRALELAADDKSSRDEPMARKLLAELDKEPFDFGVCAAMIARASLLATDGAVDQARPLMKKALTRWAAEPRPKPASDLERDVTAIRDEVFRPRGDGIFANHDRWNGYEWPVGDLPFVVAPAHISVKLPGGNVALVAVGKIDRPDLGATLFLDGDERSLLSQILGKLGGSKKREPRHVMETPNQPIGRSLDILAFWKEFFPAMAGHWGGWELASYPDITEIELLDAAHTRAEVKVTIGYAGATVILEKQAGMWKALRLEDEWIT